MAKLNKEYSNITAREFSIDSCGYNFLTLAGSHANGGYIAFPNWGISAEISNDWKDVFYNSNSIYQAIKGFSAFSGIADKIAKEIAEVLKEIRMSEQQLTAKIPYGRIEYYGNRGSASEDYTDKGKFIKAILDSYYRSVPSDVIIYNNSGFEISDTSLSSDAINEISVKHKDYSQNETSADLPSISISECEDEDWEL